LSRTLRRIRSLLLVATVATLLSSTTGRDAQAADWTIQVDPLTTALGLVHVQIEYALSDHWSVYAGPLGLFRGRTLRGELSRLVPWGDLIRKTYNALIAATADIVAGLRPRRPPPPEPNSSLKPRREATPA
jgi:hypothetical protein